MQGAGQRRGYCFLSFYFLNWWLINFIDGGQILAGAGVKIQITGTAIGSMKIILRDEKGFSAEMKKIRVASYWQHKFEMTKGRISTIVSMIPDAGNIKGIQEVLTGVDLITN